MRKIYYVIAGGGNENSATIVGTVCVWNDADNLYVKYCLFDDDPDNLLDNWYLTGIHLQVATSLDGIPQTKKGSPIPGQFEFNILYDHEVCPDPIEIPLTWDFGQELFIAAHADVMRFRGLDDFASALPDQVTMSVTYPYDGAPAYFPTVTVEGGILTPPEGSLPYLGWCVDNDHTINQNTDYIANVYSSYEDLTALNLVEFPENLDLVNWILNQGFVGQTSPGGYGTYTYGDVQRAIWELVEDSLSTNGLGSWDADRVDEILAAADASGEGFVPQCGDIVAVLLVPVNGSQIIIAQVILIGFEFPCEVQTETAWGDGIDFPGADWSTYFNYTVQNEVCGTILAPIDGQQVIVAQTLYSDLGDLQISGTVYMKVTYPVAGGPAYFPTLYIDVDKDGDWDYEYEGWCVDVGHVIYQNTIYEAQVYKCGDNLTGVVDKPENKPIVDYILSQDYVGQDVQTVFPETECTGTITYGDVQRAIWQLIDFTQSTSGLNSWSQCRVDEILATAGYSAP